MPETIKAEAKARSLPPTLHRRASSLLAEPAAAEYLGVAPGTLRNWRSQRRGPAYLRVGRRRLYDAVDLDKYLASCRLDPEAR